MEIRPAVTGDLPALEELYRCARNFMRAEGNHSQWGESYPLEVQMEEVAEDISLGRSYVCTEGEEVLAAFMLTDGPDPTYSRIDGGRWPNDRPYGVAHRVTTGGSRRGAGEFCLRWCMSRYENLRIDTHAQNRPMRSLLDKLGFVYCGVIYVEDGTPRMAYIRTK